MLHLFAALRSSILTPIGWAADSIGGVPEVLVILTLVPSRSRCTIPFATHPASPDRFHMRDPCGCWLGMDSLMTARLRSPLTAALSHKPQDGAASAVPCSVPANGVN